MGKGLETLKNIAKDKKKEKIIYILLAAVVILIASSYIFKGSKNNQSATAPLDASKQTQEKFVFNSSDLEQRLANIISKMDGISNVSCFITYKDNGTIVPLLTESKEAIYNEDSGKKEIVIEKNLCPQVEGIIVVASGLSSPEKISTLSTAIASVMNIPAYKVQIFNKEVVN